MVSNVKLLASQQFLAVSFVHNIATGLGAID
jgi:hypothetical protein